MTPRPGPLSPDARLRAEVVDRLRGGHASVTPDLALAGLAGAPVNARPDGAAHSLWELVWHVRFTQADILRFCEDADYRPPAWPEAYWPEDEGTADGLAAEIAGYLADRDRLVVLVENPATDLTAEFVPGYTVLREALLAAEHAAYHIGQTVWLRQTLGLWPPAEAASDGAPTV